MPETLIEIPAPPPVLVNNAPNVENGQMNVKFTLNLPSFTNMISTRMIEDSFNSQSKLFLTTAIGQMLQTEDFKDLMKPKIKEALMSMSLTEIMDITGKDLKGILDLLGD